VHKKFSYKGGEASSYDKHKKEEKEDSEKKDKCARENL